MPLGKLPLEDASALKTRIHMQSSRRLKARMSWSWRFRLGTPSAHSATSGPTAVKDPYSLPHKRSTAFAVEREEAKMAF